MILPYAFFTIYMNTFSAEAGGVGVPVVADDFGGGEPAPPPEASLDGANDFWLYLLTLPDDTCIVAYMYENYGATLMGNRSMSNPTAIRIEGESITIGEWEAGRGVWTVESRFFMIDTPEWRETQLRVNNPNFIGWDENEHLHTLVALSMVTTGRQARARLDARITPIDAGRLMIAMTHNLYHGLPIYTGIPGASHLEDD